MRRRYQRMYLSFRVVLLALLFSVGIMTTVYAAPAESHFGSPSYEPEYDATFPIGIYLNADALVGEYEIRLSYDTRFLEYVDGATEGGDGQILISGTLQGQSLRVLMNFRSIAVGETSLKVVSVTGKEANGDEDITVDVFPIAPISIVGAQSNDLSKLSINGKAIQDFSSEIMTYDVTVPYDDAIRVLGNDEIELEVLTDDEIDDKQTVYVRYDTADDIPVIYTFHVTWDKSNAVEEAEIQEDETNVVQKNGNADEIIEESVDVSMNETISQDAIKLKSEELIVKKRENDMLKAAIVLVVLLFIMVLVIIVRAIRVHKIKKSMEIDTRKSNLDNDFYENIESNKY